MATLVFTDAYVYINSVDLSDHVKQVALTYEAEILDSTVMGTDGTRANIPGLKNWSLEVTFLQDYGAGTVDVTLFALVGAPAFPICIRPVKSSLVGTTNPDFEGSAVLASYPPITGNVGALGECAASFKCASALARNVI
jgi:hypothetical protein